MDSRLSPSIMEDLSLVTENGLRQSIDDQTVCKTPFPLAASTVVRPRNGDKKRDFSFGDPRGSFINGGLPAVPPVYDGQIDKLTLSGTAESRKNDEIGCNDLSSRSSLGLIPADALNDLTSSGMLLNNLSKMGPSPDTRMPSTTNQHSSLTSRFTPSSHQATVNGQSTADSNEWRDSSKQDSKNHAIGSSHVIDTVKKRPERDSVPGGKHNQQGAVAMSLFTGGLLGDVSEGGEMDASIHDVQFEADELQLLDEDFSDLEEALSTDEEEFLTQGLKGQKTLTDDDKLGVNKENKEYNDGSMEGRHEAVGQESWNLDQKYFRVSPAIHNNGERREFNASKEVYLQHQGNRTNDGFNMNDYIGRYCDGEGSEMDTDDDLIEQNTPTLPSSSSTQQSHLRQAGLVGQSAPKLSYERQSGEGKVSGSPGSSVVGGTGLGDGSSGPESDDCNPRVPTSKTTPHKFAKPPTASHLDLFPGEERLRPMGNDLLSDSHMRDRYLSSAMQSAMPNTNVDLDKFLAPAKSAQTTYNQSLPQFDESSFQLEDMLHDNESESGDHLEEERMEAFGYNAADLSKVDDPFSKFNSSMGSFGLSPNSPPKNNERSTSNQKLTVNSMCSYQKPVNEASQNHSQVLTNQKVTYGASAGQNQSNMSSKFNASSPSLSVLDMSANRESNRKSGSVLHRSESLPKEKRKSESLSQTRQKLNVSQGAVNRLSRTSSDTSVKPRKDTPMPPHPQKQQDDWLSKVPKPISAIGQPSKSSTANLPKNNVLPAKSNTRALPPSKVKNLAFHSPFGEDAALQKELLSDISDVHIDDNDFCSADAGLKMFDEDEKEFNKENIFSEHDNMSDSGETIQDAQWAYRSVMSQSQCTVPDDPWSRLSVGEYWAQGTENLGTLEGDPNRPRPEFGMKIRTPPNNRKPVALFKTTDGSPVAQFGQNTPKTQANKSVVSDITFTLSDLDTPQAERLKKLTSLSENTQTLANSVNTSQSEHIATPKSKEASENISAFTNSLLNLEQSLSDQSGVLSVSAISSFINQISAQSDATELVNTIMALSKIKSKAKDSKVPESVTDSLQKQETNVNNSPKDDVKATEMRRSKLPVRRGSNKELLEKSLKSRENKETPSPPVSHSAIMSNKSTEKPQILQDSSHTGNLLDTHTDNDWMKFNQQNTQLAPDVSNQTLTSPERNQTSRSSSEWRSPRPSMGGRHCMIPHNQSRHKFDPSCPQPNASLNEKQRNSQAQHIEKQHVPENDISKNSNTDSQFGPRKSSTSQLPNQSEQSSSQTERMERSSNNSADYQIQEENHESLSQSQNRVSDQIARSIERHKSENDYSTHTNYFSPDKDLTATDDMRDSRRFENLPNVHALRPSSCHSPPVQEKKEDRVGLKKPVPASFYRHDMFVHEEPEKPTAMSDKSPTTHEFAEKYFTKEYQASGAEFKVPFPVKSSNNDPLPQDSFCSEEVSFYELQAQNLSRLSHVMSESAPSFLSQAPSYQSTPFHNKRDGSFHSMTSMTPSYMKSVLSTGPINRHYADTDTTLMSHLDASGAPMATPKQLTQLEVPTVFTFPQFSCVGIALSANLPIFNPTSRWQECILHVQDLRVNNQPVDPEKHSPFQMKSKVIIEPNSTESISVMFLPRIPGAFVAKLQIYAKPFLRDVVVAPSRIPVEVTMQAIAESPNIQVITATDDQMIHFGQLTWGACRTSSVQLRNLNKGSVPVRLTIVISKSSWQCFSFDKETATPPHLSYSKGSRPTSPVFGKNAMSLCLEGYSDRPAASLEEIKIYCKPPHKESDRALSLRPPEIFEARVNVEIDTDIPNIPPITSVVLRAEVGVAKLHTPVDLDKIFLTTTWGKKCSKSFKLKNAGNINMEVSLFVPQFSDIFPVNPRFLKIPAGQDRQLTVNFEPRDKNICNYDSLLLMGLEPDGPTYELPLKGELKQAVAPPAGPLLLSDKHSLPFGGVALGRAKQLRVTLKSNAHQALKLRVEIRSSSNAFQFQMSSMQTEASCQHRDMIIQPQEKFPIYVVYSPTRVESHNGKLVIKPYDCNAKFSISLSGYGGVSCVTLDDVNQSGTTRFWIDVGEITLNKSSMHKVAVTNTGHRAAFVKALSFTDLQLKQTLPPGRIAVDPNEFILCPKETKIVHVAFCPSDRELAACYREKDVVATVAFYHGDEVSRQKYRRAINKPVKSGKKSQKVSVELPIQKVNFDVSYKGDSGDKVVIEGNGISETDSDVDLFYTNLSHVSLALIGHPASKLETCTPQVYPKSRRSQGSNKPVEHTETLPLPGSKRSSYPSDNRLAYTSHHPGEKDCDWSVLPQQLICSVSRDGRKTQSNSFQIVNFSTRDIKYELSWPGHWFTVSPEHGTIKPKSHVMVTLCPLTNLQVSKLPWSGAVVVCCDEQFSEVKVQIKCEPTYESEPKVYDKSGSGLVPVPNQSTDTSGKCKDIEKYLDVPSTHFIFPKTLIGDHSGKTMEFTNKSNSTLSWSISSFAPAYAKGIENTSDVYRVTYSAFVVKEKTGQLLPNETAEVPLMFVPRSGGTFTQYWDLQCYLRPSVSDNSMTVRISLVGEAYKESEEKSHVLDTTNNSCDTAIDHPVTVKESLVNFSSIEGMNGTVVKIALQNESDQPCNIKVVAPKPPFYIKHQRFSIGKRRFLKYPIEFKPEGVGTYQGMITFRTDLGYDLDVQLHGDCQIEASQNIDVQKSYSESVV